MRDVNTELTPNSAAFVTKKVTWAKAFVARKWHVDDEIGTAGERTFSVDDYGKWKYLYRHTPGTNNLRKKSSCWTKERIMISEAFALQKGQILQNFIINDSDSVGLAKMTSMESPASIWLWREQGVSIMLTRAEMVDLILPPEMFWSYNIADASSEGSRLLTYSLSLEEVKEENMAKTCIHN